MTADMTEAIGSFLKKLLSYLVLDPENTSADDFGIYKAENVRDKYFIKYPASTGVRVSSLNSEAFGSWLCVHYSGDDFSESRLKNIIFNLKKSAKYYEDKIPSCKLFTRIGYSVSELGDEKIYVCLHNDSREVVEIDANGWRVRSEYEAMSEGVLFENPSDMQPLFKPLEGGSINELREFVNVDNEDFYLVLGWLLVALNIKPTMDCPILWMNAPKGTGKTTASKFLKRLIDPDKGGTISPVETFRDFSASVSSSFIVGVDNVSKISLKMSDVYCRAVTGDTSSIRKLFTNNSVNNVNLHGRLMINGINCAPARSDLQDRCFQIKLRRLTESSRKSNEELEKKFQERGPYILGALFDALSAGLKNKDYVAELGVNMRMKDACEFIMRIANTGTLPFSENEFREVLKSKKREAEMSDKSQLYENTVLSLICDMADEKYKASSDSDEVEVWNDSTGKLLEELSNRASKLEKSGYKGILKDIPTTSQKLGKELTKNEALLNDTGIYIDRTARTGNHRLTKIVYRPFDEVKSSARSTGQSNSGEVKTAVDTEIFSMDLPMKNPDKTNDEVDSIISNKMEVSPLSGQETQETGIKEQSFLPVPLKYVPFTLISGVRGIGPNSGVPLSKLTGLTTEEKKCVVMSNLFIVPYVTKNTVIWENWDIFYKRKYIWTVVRSRPGSVKIFLPFPELRFLLCEPLNENNKYKAVMLSKWGRPYVLLASGTLKEALDICEDKIDNIRYKYDKFLHDADYEIKEVYSDDIYLLPRKRKENILLKDERYKLALKFWYLGSLNLEMVPTVPEFGKDSKSVASILLKDLDEYVACVNKITNAFKIKTFRGFQSHYYWNEADYSYHIALQLSKDLGSFEEKLFRYGRNGIVLRRSSSKDERDEYLTYYRYIMTEFHFIREVYSEESLDLLSMEEMKKILNGIRSYVEVDVDSVYSRCRTRKKYVRKKFSDDDGCKITVDGNGNYEITIGDDESYESTEEMKNKI